MYLCKMQMLELRSLAPPPQRLVQMQHRQIAVIRDPSHVFEHPKPLNGPASIKGIQYPAEGAVGKHSGPWGEDRGACMFPCSDLGIVQCQGLQSLERVCAVASSCAWY